MWGKKTNTPIIFTSIDSEIQKRGGEKVDKFSEADSSSQVRR